MKHHIRNQYKIRNKIIDIRSSAKELNKRLPQMPTYHLKGPDGSGITLVNIGIGPSNAKTATDHVSVLRPHAWIMLGHCAGLRASQRLGDYVLAHAYVREDHVLDEDIPVWVPIPALAEVQIAIEGMIRKNPCIQTLIDKLDLDVKNATITQNNPN